MSPEQKRHALRLIEDFQARALKKYEAGAKEYDSNIWDMPILKLLDEAKLEFIDGFVYVSTAIEILEVLLADDVISNRVKEILA